MDIFALKKSEFPPLLLEIPDAPSVLYARGLVPHWEHRKMLAIVGSRNYSSYGREVCEKLIRELAGYPITIVSGLALGIDAIAHEAALHAGLATIAVPGSGLHNDVLYPRTNAYLAKKILNAGGLLLSEFEPHHKARPENFPQRNRIMAGMSHATLIIEAQERSGTLTTARLALDYNRDVLAVPGSIFRAHSVGAHSLIRNGAGLVSSGEDILDALSIPKELATTPEYTLSEREQIIYDALENPLPKDELIRVLALPIHEVNALLTEMELKGIIDEVMGTLKRT